ncbi:MAG: hypothetical protein ACK5XM_01465 [Betaproteobacteria bacterium]
MILIYIEVKSSLLPVGPPHPAQTNVSTAQHLPSRAVCEATTWDLPEQGLNLKTAVDGRKTHQVAVATEQFERRSITGLELLRSRENCAESRANTRSALFGSNDNCGF